MSLFITHSHSDSKEVQLYPKDDKNLPDTVRIVYKCLTEILPNIPAVYLLGNHFRFDIQDELHTLHAVGITVHLGSSYDTFKIPSRFPGHVRDQSTKEYIKNYVKQSLSHLLLN